MQVYAVGGAVRDELLGLPVNDVDWVVVGSTPEALIAQGYTPVGKDFPVFLHPKTKEEYALARTERKTAAGYHGFAVHFSPDVSLEDDLCRRDLTINAMAKSTNGEIIDPHGGKRDLEQKVFRHVSEAFREDPVRILRLARFAARFTEFSLAHDTLMLMQDMAHAGEVDALVPERVWQEIARGLQEAKPSRMFDVLRACGALKRLLPELDALWGVPQPPEHHPEIDTGVHVMMVLDHAASINASLAVRFACLMHDLGKGTTPADVLPRHIAHEKRSYDLLKKVCARWKIPNELASLAEVVALEHGNIHRCESLSPEATLRLLERCDALRRPERFLLALEACECDARGRLGLHDKPYPQRNLLTVALEQAASVNAGAIVSGLADKSPEKIQAALKAARIDAMSGAKC